jgi:hypothetical protein
MTKGLTGQAECHGGARSIIMNGFYLKKHKLDRIYRINRIFIDHFPKENGQTLSPPARWFFQSRLSKKNDTLFVLG